MRRTNRPAAPRPEADPGGSAPAGGPDGPSVAPVRPGGPAARPVGAGYTLVELAVAVVIVGLLASLAAPELQDYVNQARVARTVTEIRTVAKEVEQHRIRSGEYPESLAEIGRDGLEDPWGHPYQYLKIAGEGTGKKGSGGTTGEVRKDRFLVPLNSDFDLYSSGPDGESRAPLTAAASWDDIIRASDGEFVGPAAQY